MKILVWTTAPAFWPLFSSKEEEEQWKKDNNVKLIEMDINEAPEKLYFGTQGDKGLLDIYSKKESDDEIEYTRTDDFIKKACEWLKKSITNNPETNRIISLNGTVTMGMLIEDFRNYMKGE